MADSKKRIALKPHMEEIREWVEAGKSDEWIADALGTSASSVQSFRSRNDIYRRERVSREPESIYEGVLDKGERDGWGLWLDPAIAEDPIWKDYWAGVDAVVVKVAEDAIVLEADRREAAPVADIPVVPQTFEAPVNPGAESAEPSATDAEPSGQPDGEGSLSREQGRVKWFDADKGYGFLVRPTGEDLFVHHSEVEGDASELGPGGEVEYEVGSNDRGPNARRVQLLG